MDAYAGPDRVNNVSSSALQALSGICDEDGKLRVLVEDLLNAAVVATGLPARCHLVLRRVVLVAFWRRSCRRIVAGLVGFLWGLRDVILRIYDVPAAVSIVLGRVKGDVLEHAGRMDTARREIVA